MSAAGDLGELRIFLEELHSNQKFVHGHIENAYNDPHPAVLRSLRAERLIANALQALSAAEADGSVEVVAKATALGDSVAVRGAVCLAGLTTFLAEAPQAIETVESVVDFVSARYGHDDEIDMAALVAEARRSVGAGEDESKPTAALRPLASRKPTPIESEAASVGDSAAAEPGAADHNPSRLRGSETDRAHPPARAATDPATDSTPSNDVSAWENLLANAMTAMERGLYPSPEFTAIDRDTRNELVDALVSRIATLDEPGLVFAARTWPSRLQEIKAPVDTTTQSLWRRIAERVAERVA